MRENFCSDIIQTMKCFPLESFNLSCQAEHTKINSRLTFNPGLALIAFWTTRPSILLKKLQASPYVVSGSSIISYFSLTTKTAMPIFFI